MKYLRKFATQNDVLMLVKPNVTYVEDTKSVLYNAYGGVFIQHIDGRLFTTENWSAGGFSNDEANGVAVLADEASFVIAKTVIGRFSWSSNTNSIIEGVTTAVTVELAKQDFNGQANTALIPGGAAEACKTYIFPNGKAGYLPSFGELDIVYKNKANVVRALSLIGASGLSTYLWSSTQKDASSAWNYIMSSGSGRNFSKLAANPGEYHSTRAFTTL